VAKVVLIEGRVTDTGFEKAGSVVEMPDDCAVRAVAYGQARYENPDDAPKVNLIPITTSDEIKVDPFEGLAVSEDIKTVLANHFKTADEVYSFVNSGGDLTEKKGIGKATKSKIEAALLEWREGQASSESTSSFIDATGADQTGSDIEKEEAENSTPDLEFFKGK